MTIEEMREKYPDIAKLLDEAAAYDPGRPFDPDWAYPQFRRRAGELVGMFSGTPLLDLRTPDAYEVLTLEVARLLEIAAERSRMEVSS